MLIALSQITTGPEPAKNLDLIEEQARRAAEAGARVVVLPEAGVGRVGAPRAPPAEARRRARGAPGGGRPAGG
ncbi:nitrilase-related carbon-nitrogen hydrolase, partial [Streptomyces sp. NPDC059744]|uniref:nitrilase-related carbon-nitrogen hydrolase n=1 Tax=Streptomyces sp. NPDC059744 TaxID=3346929 RepID=UPI0036505894